MSSSEPVSAAAPGGIDHHDRSGNGDGDGDGDKGSVEVTALEQEVLGEYERLVGNMDRVCLSVCLSVCPSFFVVVIVVFLSFFLTLSRQALFCLVF